MHLRLHLSAVPEDLPAVPEDLTMINVLSYVVESALSTDFLGFFFLLIGLGFAFRLLFYLH